MSDPTLLTELAASVKYLLETGARGGLDKATLETYARRIDRAMSTAEAPAQKAVEAPPVDVKPPVLHAAVAAAPPAARPLAK